MRFCPYTCFIFWSEHNNSTSLLKPFLLISKSQLPLSPFLAASEAAPLISHSVPLGSLLRAVVRLLGVLLNGAQLDELSAGIIGCHRSHCSFSFRRTGSVRAVPSEVISFRFHVAPLTVCCNRSIWLSEHGGKIEDWGEKYSLNCWGHIALANLTLIF